MSAIYGILRFDGHPVTKDETAAVREEVRNLGPDRQEEWSSEILTLGHAMRCITKEDALGSQPLADEDASRVLSADLRLDNREELSAELGLSASQVRGMPDSEILMKAVHRWGKEAWQRCVGAMGCALWDFRCRRLVLARDAMGERTIYFYTSPRFLAFASDLKLIGTFPGIDLQTNKVALADCLFCNWTDQNRTWFKDVRQIPPGTSLTVTPEGRLTFNTYFDRNSIPDVRFKSRQDYLEAFEERLSVAVRRQTRGAKGVLTHLSSGLDSSAVTAFAAPVLAEQNRPHFAFTLSSPVGQQRYVPSGRFADERPLASKTAALYPNIRHVAYPFPDTALLEDMHHYSSFNQKIFIPMPYNHAGYEAAVVHAAARGANLVLNGSSGNFGFSYTGFDAMTHHLLNRRWSTGLRLLRATAKARKRSVAATSYQFILAPLLRWWLLRLSTPLPLGGPALQSMINRIPLQRSFLHDHDMLQRARRSSGLNFIYGAIPDTRDKIFQYFQGPHWAKDMDRHFKIRHGVEVRDPLSDRDLVAFCLGIPESCYLTGGRPRAMAVDILKNKIPDEVIRCPQRGFQQANWEDRFQRGKPIMAALIKRFEDFPSVRQIIDTTRLKSAVNRFAIGRKLNGRDFFFYYNLIPMVFLIGDFLLKEELPGTGTAPPP